MKQSGQILLYLIFTVIIIAGAGMIWYVNVKSPVIENDDIKNSKVVQTIKRTKPQIPNDWAVSTFGSVNLLVRYPANWQVTDGKYLSQFPYNPESKSITVSNAIDFQNVKTILFQGYQNVDAFHLIKDLNENQYFTNQWYPSDERKVEKIASGKVYSDQDYVIFSYVSKDSEVRPSEIYAYILNGTDIIQLKLVRYNAEGIEFLKQILTLIEVNKP